MTNASMETLSTSVDGELPKQELRFLLRRIRHETVLLEAWSSYHLVRECMRHQLSVLAPDDMAERVMTTIDAKEDHAPYPSYSPDIRRGWLRWVTGSAIAASVAMVALMTVQPNGRDDTGMTDIESIRVSNDDTVSGQWPVAVAVNPSLASVSKAPATVPPWLSGNAAYLLSERASMTLTHGMWKNTPHAMRMRDYQMLDRGGHDGSYLLLIRSDPTMQSRLPADQVR